MSEHERWEELAAGYALDALEPEDEQLFVEHLMECDRCREALEAYADAAAALGGAAPVEEPPPGLRDAILTQALLEADQPAQQRRAPVEAAHEHTSPAPVVPTQQRRAPRVLAVLAGLVVLVLAVGVAGVAWHRADRADDQRRQAQGLLEVESRPGARTVPLSGPAGSSGRAVIDGRDVWLVTDGVASNDRSTSTYVLWAARPSDGRMLGVGAFDVGSKRVSVAHLGQLPDGTSASSVLAVTYENGRDVPAGPSSSVVLRAT